MSEIRGVVVAHGNLASCLVDTAEGIAGATEAVVPISNADCGREELEVRIRDAVGGEPAVVFVDLASGSCAHAARLATRNAPDACVVTGVNLPMLLDFVFHRDMPLSELMDRLGAKGQSGIKAYRSDPTE